MDDLAAALRSADWPTALALALALWREHRSPELATLIETIDAKLPTLPAPKANKLQAWWMEHADPYDPLGVGALVARANASIKLAERDPHEPPKGLDGAYELSRALALITHTGQPIPHSNAFSRLGALMRWPADPRAATILLDWLCAMPVRWDPLSTGRATEHFYAAIADQLKGLADARHLPRLVECERAPRGPTAGLRQQQGVLARQIRAAIEQRVPPSTKVAAEIAACAALVAARRAPIPDRTRGIDEAMLWRECAKLRGDPAPRLVLADFLSERGDSRGELITLHCAGTAKAGAAASRLLKANWNAWLGDLALVLNRKGTEFVGGMLEVARVGIPKSPAWAFTKLSRHRELGTIHTVRPGHVRPEDYAVFLATPGLAPDRIAIDAPEVITHMRSVRKRWVFRALEYGHYSVRDGYRYEFPPLARTFAAIAELVPGLEEIRIDPLLWPEGAGGQVRALIPALPTLFPALKRITLADGALLEELHGMPLVSAAS